MRVPRIFVKQTLSSGTTLKLEGQESHYINNVLRMDAGRPLTLFCGDGAEYSAEITQCGKKFTEINIKEQQRVDRESPINTHLAIGVSKGDRMDWVLQKATELGVTEITPLFTERTEVRLKGDRLEKKLQHWQQITVSACEQSQRNVLPVFNQALNLDDFLTKQYEGLKLVLHHRTPQTFKDLPKPQSVLFLIGPEGGLSDAEIQLALDNGYQALSLGPRVLRTETAPITILSCIQLLWGDFN